MKSVNLPLQIVNKRCLSRVYLYKTMDKIIKKINIPLLKCLLRSSSTEYLNKFQTWSLSMWQTILNVRQFKMMDKPFQKRQPEPAKL